MPNLSTGSAVKILVLGATGLLGNAVFRGLSKASDARVTGNHPA